MNLFHPHSICRLMCPALFLLSACSASDAPGEASGTFVPVQISSVALPTEFATRSTEFATRTTSSLTSGSIGVFSTTTAHSYSKVYNAEYTCNSGVWNSATPITVAGYPTTLCAYHPYGAASFAPGSTSFDLTAQLYSAAQDLSYAPTSPATQADNNDVDVSFAMVRGYAQLSLAITRQTGYSGGACKISDVSLKKPSGNLQSVRTLDISNRTYGDKTTQETLSFTNLGALQSIGISSGTTDTSLHLLLPPQTGLGGLHLLLTIDGVVRSLAIGSAQLSEWAAGTNYVVSVHVNDTGVLVSSVSTKDWENKVCDGGTQVGTPDGFVVLPDIGLRVAKGNLMRAGATGIWYLAPDQGYYTGQKDGGDYFCWGIADPTRIKDTTGASMDALTAGCVAVLGTGWRVPTKADNVALASCPRFGGTYVSQRGESNGMYFGTSSQPVPVVQDNYAFLPAAGRRFNTGAMDYLSLYGNYWSSEPNGGGGAFFLDFASDGGINGANNANRSMGLPVRCVADN